jgi:hypothetical protein
MILWKGRKGNKVFGFKVIQYLRAKITVSNQITEQ